MIPPAPGHHVIYVLGDAKHPEKYGGFRLTPSVPFFVKVWKGPLKWLGGIGMMAGVLGFHALRPFRPQRS